MADLKEDRIDFGKLEKELFAAVEADASYWRENDAKLRAMDQRVESYDQFRDMVAAAHIKPLDKKDKIGQSKRLQPWNPFSSSNSSSSTSSHSSPDTGGQTTVIKGMAVPKNGHEFTKQWHRQKKSPAEQYTYLVDLGGENLAKIFRAEISFGLLGEIITILDGGIVAENCGKVAEILRNLSQAGRFGLSLDFLSKAEKQTMSDLLAKLEKWTDDAQSVGITVDYRVVDDKNNGGDDMNQDGEVKKGTDDDNEGQKERKEEDNDKDHLKVREGNVDKEKCEQIYPCQATDGILTEGGSTADNCNGKQLTQSDIMLLRELYKL